MRTPVVIAAASLVLVPVPVHASSDVPTLVQTMRELSAAAELTASQRTLTIDFEIDGIRSTLRRSVTGDVAVTAQMVGLSSQYVTLADGRSFSSLSDSMSARELGTVRSYLKVPGLTWKLMPRAEILLHESTMIATPSTLTAASVHMQPDGSRLFTVQDGPDARGEYVIDSAGRLTSARLWVRDRGAWMPASKVLSSFEPVTVNPPASGTYLAEDVVQTAYEAARLPRTLRAVTREVRRSRPRTVGILARSTKRAVAVVNRIVSVPSARVRWARRPQGVKIWAHNRYTDATVSCRMVGPQDWATICSP